MLLEHQNSDVKRQISHFCAVVENIEQARFISLKTINNFKTNFINVMCMYI